MTATSFIVTTLALLAPSFAAPAGMDSFEASALLDPSLVKLKSEAGQRRVEGVARVLSEQLSHRDRTSLGRKVLSPRRVEVATGQFPGGADALVTVSVDLRMKDPAAPQQYISGVFTMTASGELGAVLVPLQMRAEHFHLVSAGDVDGDGTTDAVIAELSEGGEAMHLFNWAGAVPADHVVLPGS